MMSDQETADETLMQRSPEPEAAPEKVTSQPQSGDGTTAQTLKAPKKVEAGRKLALA